MPRREQIQADAKAIALDKQRRKDAEAESQRKADEQKRIKRDSGKGK